MSGAESSVPVAVYDASVLYPSLIRNLLMHLAVAGLVAARWTDAIHGEWTRNLLADRADLTPQRLERTRRLMELAVPDAGVTGFEALIPDLRLPDPDDRHVLAAAVKARAELIVTLNLKDFPPASLGEYGLEAVTPDELVCCLLKESRGVVASCSRVMGRRAPRRSTSRPTGTAARPAVSNPSEKAPEVCARVQPSSASIGLTSTPKA